MASEDHMASREPSPAGGVKPSREAEPSAASERPAWPETRDDLVARFCEPNHNGRISIENRALFERFVDAALSRPDPLFAYAHSETPIDAGTLCNRMYDRNLFLSIDTGWIDRDGNFWPCGYAAHEYLLELMGMNSIEQELEGWIKLSRRVAHARFAPNDAQMSAILKIIESVEAWNRGDEADSMPGYDIDLSKLRDLPPLPLRREPTPLAAQDTTERLARPRDEHQSPTPLSKTEVQS